MERLCAVPGQLQQPRLPPWQVLCSQDNGVRSVSQEQLLLLGQQMADRIQEGQLETGNFEPELQETLQLPLSVVPLLKNFIIEDGLYIDSALKGAL